MSTARSPSLWSVSQWSTVLQSTILRCTNWKSVTVLQETDSTQDFARTLGPGEIVIAARQIAGRGRLGRSWLDTGDAGLAISMNVATGSSELLALSSAVATAEAIEDVCRASSGHAPITQLKWPNDVMIAKRKVGGILIERHDRVTTIGIGINCSQRGFPAQLAERATSLTLQGFEVDRIEVARALLMRFDYWLGATDEAIESAFVVRDALVGTCASFRTPDGMIEGMVLRIDPARGLVVRTSRGDQWLSAATTSVFVPEDRTE